VTDLEFGALCGVSSPTHVPDNGLAPDWAPMGAMTSNRQLASANDRRSIVVSFKRNIWFYS
jgi:hypothetical protein